MRDFAIRFAFESAGIQKVETEVYSSNEHSLGALSGRHSVMVREGVQRETIVVDNKPFDRILFGLTLAEYHRAVEFGRI
jgi:RimJ/RimL family protein N-acetyltransferase